MRSEAIDLDRRQEWTKEIKPPSFSLGPLATGIEDLVRYRDLLYTLTLHRIKVRYKQSALGIAWAVLQPVLLMAVYTVIFSVVAKMPSDGAPYAVFVYAALLPWTFFSTALSTAATSLVSHNSLITKVYFPREIVPFTYVLAALFDFAIASVVLGALLIYYRVPVSALLVLALLVMLVAAAFATAAALLVSAIQVRFRDIAIAMPLLMQLLMYACPVVYPFSVVPKRWAALYAMNPMAGVVENFRRVVIEQKMLDWQTLWPGLVVSLVALPLAYLYFKNAERTMADII